MNAPFPANAMVRTPESDQVYKQIRQEIHFELNLVNGRVNWLIASQAFLFMPLTIAARGRPLVDSVMYPLIPVIGLVICVLVAVSISAAVWRSFEWRIKACKGAYTGVGEQRTFSVVTPKTPLIPLMGVVAAIGVPLVLAVAWSYLLILPPV